MNAKRYGRFLSLALLIAVVASLSSLNAQESSPSPTLNVLYTFIGQADGAVPTSGVTLDLAGNVYGTTFHGGNRNDCIPWGCGVAYKVDTRNHESLLHTFTGQADGANPEAGLVRDSSGLLYGAASGGGAHGDGNVFKLQPFPTPCATTLCPWKETVLYSFGSISGDGQTPVMYGGGLIRDAAGNMYGTTLNGGLSGLGTVFRVDPHGNETILHSFSGADGANPFTALFQDQLGNLYGTTSFGGTSNEGVVFELSPNGTGWNLSVLYSFSGGDDGAGPNTVIMDAHGNLYGTTVAGGASGQGVVFELSPTFSGWLDHTIYTFTGFADGGTPNGGLTMDNEGNLYGTTLLGGSMDGNCSENFGCGVVFELNSSGETVLWTFTGGSDGSQPYAGVVLDGQGHLYGTAGCGGDLTATDPNCPGGGVGVVFKLTP